MGQDQLQMARALAVVRMRRLGYSFGVIGRFHGISRQYAKVIYDSTPEHARRRPGQILDEAFPV